MATEPVLPAGLFVHPGHTWAQILRSGLVRIGFLAPTIVERCQRRDGSADIWYIEKRGPFHQAPRHRRWPSW